MSCVCAVRVRSVNPPCPSWWCSGGAPPSAAANRGLSDCPADRFDCLTACPLPHNALLAGGAQCTVCRTPLLVMAGPPAMRPAQHALPRLCLSLPAARPVGGDLSCRRDADGGGLGSRPATAGVCPPVCTGSCDAMVSRVSRGTDSMQGACIAARQLYRPACHRRCCRRPRVGLHVARVCGREAGCGVAGDLPCGNHPCTAQHLRGVRISSFAL